MTLVPSDVDAAVIAHLKALHPTVVVADAPPNPRPDVFITVITTSGLVTDRVMETTDVEIMAWAPTRTAAHDLAAELWGALNWLGAGWFPNPAGVWVQDSTCGRIIPNPDPVSGTPRCMFTAFIRTRMKETP